MRRLESAVPGRAAAVGCLVLAVAVASCGSAGDATETPLGQQQNAGTPATGQPAATSEGGTPGAATDAPGSAVIDVTDVTEQATGFPGLPSFTSPTGNITCTMANSDQGAYAVCSVAEADWQVPDPGDCDLDWVTTELSVGETSSAGSCRGDYPHTEEPTTLEYGRGLRVADVVCESRDTGMTCSNTETGHGFHASRGSYRAF